MSSLVAEGGRRVVTKTSASSITATSGVEICSRNSSKRIVGTKESGVSSSSSTSVTTTPQVVSSSSQLPSPLPSPPPPLLSSSSSLLSISGATKQSRLNSDPIQLVISHSTPPQSPFMLDEKQATTPFSLNRTTNTNSITTTTNTTHLATTTATGDAGGTPPDESGVIVAAAAAAVSSTVVSNDSTVEAHTPPESNDGTETQIRLAELKNKLARFNVLNAAFQRDLSLNASALDTSRRRLRDIHVATFNRHVAAYLDHKQQSMDDQVVGDEIAYELARRKDDDRKDHGYDDDDQVSTSSSSSSSEDECDDQLIVDTESRGLENDFYFRTTGDVHCSAQLADQSADDYWNLRRVRLGGEWERVQAKMKYLKHTNEQLDKYLASEREIEKLSRSLKQSLKQTFSASSTSSLLDDDEDEGVSADDELDQPKQQQQQQQQQKEDETSRRVICHQRPASARHQQTHSFDELTLLKSFYVTLMHFRTSLFKRTCMCDEENAINRRPTASRRRRQQQQQQLTSLDKTCIFCHMFKKYDSHLVQSRPTASVPDTQFIRADERVIRLYHSYCKQPKYGDKLNWSTKGETIKTSTRRRNHLDDYYELSRLVNDRLSKLLERRSAGIKLENEPMDESLNAKLYQKREVELDNIDIDPGYEISLDDIKKLPDFSYEELKFLCEDTGDDENNLMDGNKRKELDSVVVVDQNVENSPASKRLRHSR